MADVSTAPMKVDDATPGRVLAIDGLRVGDAVEQDFAFDTERWAAFGTVANDRAPVHDDPRFARDMGFDAPIIQGLCVVSRFSRLIGMYLPGETAILEGVSFKYRKATHVGEALTYRAEVTRILVPMRVVRLALSVVSARGRHVTGEAQCLLR